MSSHIAHPALEYHTYEADAPYVVITACGANEHARELMCEGRIQGAFTFHLLQYLHDLLDPNNSHIEELSQLTYTYLIHHLNIHISKSSLEISQHPQCYGQYFGKRRLFSTTRLVMGDHAFPVFCDEDGTVHVKAGCIHGIREGTQFIVQTPHQQGSKPPLTFTAQKINFLDCTVNVGSSSGSGAYGDDMQWDRVTAQVDHWH